MSDMEHQRDTYRRWWQQVALERDEARDELRRSRDAHNLAIRERDALQADLDNTVREKYRIEMERDGFRDEVAGFEAMWEQREKAHDAALAEEVEKRKAARADADEASEAAWSNRKLVEMLEAQLATAKREAHDAITAALKEMGDGFFSQIEMQGARSLASRVRIRIGLTIDPDSGSTCKPDCTRVGYCAPGEGCHATPSGETKRMVFENDEDGYEPRPSAPMVRPATPSPEAREVPRDVMLRVERESLVRITPEVAKRIVAMGTEVRDA